MKLFISYIILIFASTLDALDNNSSYTCDIFPDVLTSYSQEKYEHTFFTTALNTNESFTQEILTNESYGNITFIQSGNGNSGKVNSIFDPQTSYENSSRKYVLIGDITHESNAKITFNEGDYYIKSWDFNGQSVEITINGDVKIFILNDFNLNMGDVEIINGMPFIYTYANVDILSDTNNPNPLNLYLYTKGNLNITDTKNKAEITGALTAEGDITTSGEITFTYDVSGLAACSSSSTNDGSVDAWDVNLPSIDARSISTKISSKPFTLDFAILDEDSKEKMTYMLWDYDTDSAVTEAQTLNKNDEVLTFDVPGAYRDVRVKFLLCFNSQGHAVNCSSITQGNSPHSMDAITVSSDNFAIRPDKFDLSPTAGQDINHLISAKDYMSLKAADFNSASVANYNTEQLDMYSNLTKYMPNGDVNNSLYGSSIIDENNGNSLVSYSDIGKINIQMQDTSWAQVDIDSGDTPADCSANGAYICGDINATFIPSHFELTNTHLKNHNDGNFTYIANRDPSMSAHVSTTITAKNFLNSTTMNFDSASWENNVSFNISINTLNTPTLNMDAIDSSTKLEFLNGSYSIAFDDIDPNKKLMFNFNRDVNESINPFMVYGSDINLSVTSTYDTVNISGYSTADENATFLYARTHTTRQRYARSDGRIPIYYEIYANESADKSLLPDGINSKFSDDPRWFINTKHTSEYGTSGNISQKNLNDITATIGSGNHQDYASITYNGSTYPYKATMKITPQSWLIYNKYNSSAAYNEFEVEFELDTTNINVNSNWSGTTNQGAIRTNRRSMW